MHCVQFRFPSVSLSGSQCVLSLIVVPISSDASGQWQHVSVVVFCCQAIFMNESTKNRFHAAGFVFWSRIAIVIADIWMKRMGFFTPCVEREEILMELWDSLPVFSLFAWFGGYFFSTVLWCALKHRHIQFRPRLTRIPHVVGGREMKEINWLHWL